MSPVVGVWALFIAIVRLFFIWVRGRDPGGTGITSDGEQVNVKINRGKGGSINGVSASFALPGDLQFTFRRERVFDRLAKSLHIAKELQTSDIAFDGRVYIESEDPALHDALALRPELRNRIFELLSDSAANEVGAMRGRLWLRASGYGNRREQSNETLRLQVAADFLPAVRALRKELATVGGSGTVEGRDHTRTIRGWISVAVVGCVLAGIAGLINFMSREKEQVVVAAISSGALTITLGTLAAFLIVLFTLLRSTAFTHRVLFDILFAVVPATWVAASGGLIYYNQAHDRNPSDRIDMRVESAYTTIQKKRTYYHLVVVQWPDARGDRYIEVDEHLYTMANTNKCISVIWHKGALGDGWYEGLQPSQAAICDNAIDVE